MTIKSRNLGKDTWTFQVPSDATTANTKIANFKNAAGTVKAYVDIEGDISCHDLAVSGTFTLPSSNFASGLTVATDKLTVSAAGALAAASTIACVGDLKVNTDKFVVTATSGNTAVAGTLSATSDFKVNTDKFVVTASSGATAIAGDLAVATSKLTVASATGNTVVAGTFKQGAAISGATLSDKKGCMTWTSSATDIASITAGSVVATDFTLTGVAAGDKAQLINASGDFLTNVGSLVWNCICSTNTIKLIIGNLSGADVDLTSQTYTFYLEDLS